MSLACIKIWEVLEVLLPVTVSSLHAKLNWAMLTFLSGSILLTGIKPFTIFIKLTAD